MMATQNLCLVLCIEYCKQLRCPGEMRTSQCFLSCSAPGHAPCCCLAAWEAAKEIESFIQKDTLSPQCLTKGVGSCKTEARGTGPLTPPKPLGRLLVSSFHCYAYKTTYQVNVGVEALFGSLVWKNTCKTSYRALAVFPKFSFSGTLLPWWTVLLC